MSEWFELSTDTLALGLVIRATGILAVAGFAVLLLRSSSAATRHSVWSVAMFSVLVLPLLQLVASPWPVIPSWYLPALAPEATLAANITPSEQPRVHPRLMPGVLPARVMTDSQRPAEPESSHVVTAETHSALPFADAHPVEQIIDSESSGSTTGSFSFRWMPVLGVIWLVGCLVVAMPLLLGTIELARTRRRSRIITEGPHWDAMEQTRSRLGIRRRVLLLSSPHRTFPMTWGTLYPCLLLPEQSAEWPADQVKVAVAHELAHIRRLDSLTQIVTHIVCSLFWFHPLAWLAARAIRNEREMACDDLVLHMGWKPTNYADHMLAIVSRGQWQASAVSIGMAHSAKIEQRVKAILDNNRTRGVTRAALSLVCLAAIALTLPVALATVKEDAPSSISNSTAENSTTENSDNLPPVTKTDKKKLTARRPTAQERLLMGKFRARSTMARRLMSGFTFGISGISVNHRRPRRRSPDSAKLQCLL